MMETGSGVQPPAGGFARDVNDCVHPFEPSTAPRDCPSALDCSPNQPRRAAHRYISGGYILLPWAWLIGAQTERLRPVCFQSGRDPSRARVSTAASNPRKV